MKQRSYWISRSFVGITVWAFYYENGELTGERRYDNVNKARVKKLHKIAREHASGVTINILKSVEFYFCAPEKNETINWMWVTNNLRHIINL